MCTEKELPQYKCHKVVWALEIEDVSVKDDGTATIIPVDKGFGCFAVPAEYVNKHKPQAGGYYVVYEGGYRSWSPADVFEAGYTRLGK